MPLQVAALAGTAPHHPRDGTRLRVALLSIGWTLGFSSACSRWPDSDGRMATWMDGINLLLLGGYAWWATDRPMSRLLAAAGAFGAVELLADFLCVRCTGTLDYAVARSTLVLASPWWMPLSWAVVAVQMGIGGDAAIRRFGLGWGAMLCGLLGAVLIPVYEELAWGAHWWRYQRCLCIGHTPVYIVVAEAFIGLGLAGLGYGTLRVRAACRRLARGGHRSADHRGGDSGLGVGRVYLSGGEACVAFFLKHEKKQPALSRPRNSLAT